MSKHNYELASPLARSKTGKLASETYYFIGEKSSQWVNKMQLHFIAIKLFQQDH